MFIEACPADSSFSLIGQTYIATDTMPVSEYFGLMYAYTSTKDRLLTFDDLKISAMFSHDTLPPVLESVSFPARTSLEFRFNEEVTSGSQTGITVGNDIIPDSFYFDKNISSAKFRTEFANDQDYPFRIENIADRKGNKTGVKDTFTFFIPSRHDIIFSEIMADPSPPVYLPESEYLELYNRSKHPVNLEGWTIKAGARNISLSKKDIPAGGYHIVCDEAAGWLYPPGISSPVISSASVLNNSGQLLILQNQQSEIIDALEYKHDWYADELKSEGGWSLERIDFDFLCGDTPNWKASESPDGGTPGLPNSVFGKTVDHTEPCVQYVICDSTGHFRLVFSEPVLTASPDPYKILQPLMHAGMGIPSILSELFSDTLSVTVPSEYGKDPLPVIFGAEFSDCSGNVSFPCDTFYLGMPLKPLFTDIIITEVLYSPFPGCSEFVEIFNRSENIISLNDLALVIRGDNSEESKSEYISEENILFFPHTYLILAPDPGSLNNYYDVHDSRTLFGFSGMPALGNSGGTIRLTLRSAEIIDEMHYGPDDQYPFIPDDHGISLERMTTGPESGLTAPWHSSSSLSGFATPGYRNSQFLGSLKSESSFSVDKDIFTPDNDGVDDVAVFRFHFEQEGYVGTLRIFDPLGYLVCTIWCE